MKIIGDDKVCKQLKIFQAGYWILPKMECW